MPSFLLVRGSELARDSAGQHWTADPRKAHRFDQPLQLQPLANNMRYAPLQEFGIGPQVRPAFLFARRCYVGAGFVVCGPDGPGDVARPRAATLFVGRDPKGSPRPSDQHPGWTAIPSVQSPSRINLLDYPNCALDTSGKSVHCLRVIGLKDTPLFWGIDERGNIGWSRNAFVFTGSELPIGLASPILLSNLFQVQDDQGRNFFRENLDRAYVSRLPLYDGHETHTRIRRHAGAPTLEYIRIYSEKPDSHGAVTAEAKPALQTDPNELVPQQVWQQSEQDLVGPTDALKPLGIDFRPAFERKLDDERWMQICKSGHHATEWHLRVLGEAMQHLVIHFQPMDPLPLPYLADRLTRSLELLLGRQQAKDRENEQRRETCHKLVEMASKYFPRLPCATPMPFEYYVDQLMDQMSHMLAAWDQLSSVKDGSAKLSERLAALTQPCKIPQAGESQLETQTEAKYQQLAEQLMRMPEEQRQAELTKIKRDNPRGHLVLAQTLKLVDKNKPAQNKIEPDTDRWPFNLKKGWPHSKEARHQWYKDVLQRVQEAMALPELKPHKPEAMRTDRPADCLAVAVEQLLVCLRLYLQKGKTDNLVAVPPAAGPMINTLRDSWYEQLRDKTWQALNLPYLKPREGERTHMEFGLPSDALAHAVAELLARLPEQMPQQSQQVQDLTVGTIVTSANTRYAISDCRDMQRPSETVTKAGTLSLDTLKEQACQIARDLRGAASHIEAAGDGLPKGATGEAAGGRTGLCVYPALPRGGADGCAAQHGHARSGGRRGLPSQ